MLISLIVVLAIPTAFAVVLLAPQRRQASELEADRAEEEEVYVAMMEHRTQRESLQHECETWERELAQRSQRLFGTDRSPLYMRLEGLARGAGVLITEVNPTYLPGGEKSGVLAAMVSLQVEGRYHSVATFVDQLEKSGAFGLITELKISPAGDRAGVAKGSLAIRAICGERESVPAALSSSAEQPGLAEQMAARTDPVAASPRACR